MKRRNLLLGMCSAVAGLFAARFNLARKESSPWIPRPGDEKKYRNLLPVQVTQYEHPVTFRGIERVTGIDACFKITQGPDGIRYEHPDEPVFSPCEFEDLAPGDIFRYQEWDYRWKRIGKRYRALSVPVPCEPKGNFAVDVEEIL